jgi:hypothetical protein
MVGIPSEDPWPKDGDPVVPAVASNENNVGTPGTGRSGDGCAGAPGGIDVVNGPGLVSLA